MTTLKERLKILAGQHADETSRRKRMDIQMETDSKRHLLRVEELKVAIKQKFTLPLLKEINSEYLNGRGKIHIIKNGQKIKFPDTYFSDGGFCDEGKELGGPNAYLLWDRRGDDREGSIQHYSIHVDVYGLLPKGMDLESQEAKNLLLSERTKTALEEKILMDFTKYPDGYTIIWTHKAQHSQWENM